MSGELCSMPNCSELPRTGQRYCKACHSLYMKAWRAKRRREEHALRKKVLQLRQKVLLQNQELEELRNA